MNGVRLNIYTNERIDVCMRYERKIIANFRCIELSYALIFSLSRNNCTFIQINVHFIHFLWSVDDFFSSSRFLCDDYRFSLSLWLLLLSLAACCTYTHTYLNIKAIALNVKIDGEKKLLFLEREWANEKKII